MRNVGRLALEHAPALAPLAVIVLALSLCLATSGCAGYLAGLGRGPTTRPTAAGFFDRVADGAAKIGAAATAAGAAIAPANPVAGGAVIAFGTVASAVGGLFSLRRAVWGTWKDRRDDGAIKPRRELWTPEQRAAVAAASSSTPPAAVAVASSPRAASSTRRKKPNQSGQPRAAGGPMAPAAEAPLAAAAPRRRAA